jgi:uncharacterized membrane protein
VTPRRWLLAAFVPVVLLTIGGLLALWPSEPVTPIESGTPVRGTVEEVLPCRADPAPDCAEAVVTIDEGPDAGARVLLPAPRGAGAPELAAGDGIVLLAALADPTAPLDERYAIRDFQRDVPLAVLAGLFALAVVALAGWRGAAALAGLAASLGLLLVFVLPALLTGGPPLLVAVVGATCIAVVTMLLSHGPSERTLVALLGTVVALAVTTILGSLFSEAARLTGLADESAALLVGFAEVDPRGLLLAGLVIGALGVLDDVTVTQAAAVWEVAAADPAMPRRRLVRAGLRVGRDHVAATVNTLALAYAGAALPLLLLFVVGGAGFGGVVTSELVAQEVVRALVGSLGIVAAVPITTALAAAVVTAGRDYPVPDPSHHRK